MVINEDWNRAPRTTEEARREVLEILDRSIISPKFAMQMCLTMLDTLIKGDHVKRANNDVEAERRIFEALSRIGETWERKHNVVSEFVFHQWVETSPNLFAVVYRLGALNATAESTRKRLKPAVAGRRLIGANSRAKVKKAAGSFRYMSKERAAAAMAEIVNLEAGTIRRYLSEIFPGDTWKP